MRNSNLPFNKELRQQLRRDSTSCERILWRKLSKKQIDGFRFRRQHGFDIYVMDFYCPQAKLCIEVDGEVHDSLEKRKKDAERTAFLNQCGIKVVRFKNEEIENNIDDVVHKIRLALLSRVESGFIDKMTTTVQL